MIDYLLQLRAFLQGKKLYLSMIAAIVSSIAAWSNGLITDAELMRALFDATGFVTLRAGVAKLQTGGSKE